MNADIASHDIEEFFRDRIEGATAAKLIGDAMIRTEELRWTADLVKVRISEAAQLCERITPAAGPSRKSGFWPGVMELPDATEDEKGYGAKLGEQVRLLQEGLLSTFAAMRGNKPRGGADIKEITEMNAAIQWPAIYLSATIEEEPRRALNAFWLVEAHDLPRGDAWKYGGFNSERTYDRRLEDACEAILAGLLRDGVLA